MLRKTTPLLLLIIIFTFLLNHGYSQCSYNNTFYTDLTPPGIGMTDTEPAGYGGDLYTVSVVAGETYVFSTCNSGIFSYDTQLTLYNNTGTIVLDYNDDYCAPFSQITWTATYTGVVHLLLDEYNCSNTGGGGFFDDCVVEVTWMAPPACTAIPLEPICTSVGLDFPAGVTGTDATVTDPGNEWDCILDAPDATFYYLEIATAGNINMTLNGSAADVDFIIWGPFTDLTTAEDNCGLWGNGGSTGNVIDCSFSTSATEYPDITAATVGQVYVMMVSNYAGVPQDITLQQTGGSGATDCSIVCGADAGTVTTQINAGAASSPLILCQNDCVAINSNNDYTLPTPAPGEGSELIYAIYDCPPTTGNPSTDPCWTGFYWTGEDFSDCNNGGSALLGLAMGRVFYLAPITADDGDNVNPATLGHDNDGDGCFDQGTAVQVVYLNPIAAVGAMNNCTGVATITVTGGMPQYNGSNYTIINTGPGTLTGTPITHNGSVTVTGLTNGQTVTLTITDAQGCSYPLSYGPVTVETPANAGTDGIISICSTDSPINLYASLGGTPQATGSWTGGLTGGNLGTYDPATFSSGTFTYTDNGTGGCPNASATVTVTENPAVNAGIDGSTSICDNSIAVIDLFSLISGEQAGGTWTRTTGTGGTFNAGSGTFTPASGATSSTFTYSLTGTAPCPNDQSLATVTISAAPNAGTDGSTSICDNSVSVIDLFSLIAGEQAGGTWIRSTGTGGTFNAGAGTFTPASGATTSTFTYTITGVAPCVDDQSVVTININPVVDAGIDGSTSICETNVAVIDLFSIITGEQAGGTWTQTSGSGGSFNAGAGTFTPAIGATTSTFTYTMTGVAPCANDQSVATINITAAPNAGTDGAVTICESSVATIDLYGLITGEQAGGTWTQTTGSGGVFNAGAGTFTPSAGATSSTFMYSLTGVAPCVNDQSTASITITPDLDAGTDGNTTICESDLSVIDLYSLISGEQAGGTWVRTTGSGGSFNAGAGTFTSAVGATTSTFTYTLTGTAPCVDDQSVATITIIAAPNAGIDGNTSVCETNVAVIDLFALITGEQAGGTWTQTSGSGGTFNAGAGTFTPAAGATSSTFTYTINGTAPCLNDQSVVTVNITAAPNAGTDGSTSICETNGTVIDLYGLISGEQVGGTWSQTSGTGGTFNAAAGTYTPVVGATSSTFSYTVNGSAPCVNDVSVATVNITAAPNAGLDGNTSVCETSVAVIDLYSLITGEQAGGSWTQSSGTGGTFNAGLGTYTPAIGATTSVFTYTVSGTAPCIDDQSTVTVNITSAPNAGADGNTTVCESSTAAIDLYSLISGEQVGGSWTQTSGSGGTFNAGAGTFTPALGAMNSTFTYTVTGTAPCVDDQSVVTVNITASPNAGSDGNTSICESNLTSIDLFSLITGEQAGGTWTQTSGTGGTFNSASGTYTPSMGATTSVFVYTITGVAPCVDDQSIVTINITAEPNAGTDGSISICDNSTVTIDLFSLISGEQSGGSWTQSTGTGGTFNSGAGTYIPAMGATSSSFIYTISGISPCVDDQSTVTINISATPSAPMVNKDTTYCMTDSPTAMTCSGSGGTYTWYSDPSFTNMLGTGTSLSPPIQMGSNTFYVTESNGNCESPAEFVIIEFVDCDSTTEVVVPSAFTPNNDLENDEWEIVNIDETYPDNQVFVYNRWGALIFESIKGDYSSKRWDGTFKGDKLPVASYYYIIYTTGDASGEMLKGTVTIINAK